ncbi:AAA family ATPase [Pseudomonas umsongensis]|uniref:AAA family ATPase n=1 Tax=Pseudomonas umsongensis TaxID=198618 RepID=UPI003D7F74AB
MKILSFKAIGVHDFLNFNIDFNDSLNFIAGLNGSGKTTALNLINLLLAPSIEELARIKFEALVVVLLDEESESKLTIKCLQTKDAILLNTSDSEEWVTADISEILHSDDKTVTNRLRSNSVFKRINTLTPPMYLSLDRRFVKDSKSEEIDFRWMIPKPKSLNSELDSSMKDALDIVSKKSAEVKEKQAAADKRLRNKIILDSFATANGVQEQMPFPDRRVIQTLKSKQATIKKTLKNLDFETEEFESLLDNFFANLTSLAKSALATLRPSSDPVRPSSKNSATHRIKSIDSIPPQRPEKKSFSEENSQVLAKWFVNSHQLGRINRLVKLIDEYEKDQVEINSEIEKFTLLVNSFLEQTSKKIIVTNRGEIKIFIASTERTLTVMSSGERQILIILAHLCLNSSLPKNGVFIVDEPELSLHLAWQEMFVEAVQAASPHLQIILATHSPAIIGGRNNFYIPLYKGDE